jgi:tetratricopeptide (TPR) repeat protein/TolB-like protein
MRYVEGTELAEVIAGPALPIAKVIDFAIQIGRGLEAAHEAGIIHRDLKPRNIRVTETPGSTQLRLLDFGLARKRRQAVETLGPTEALSREALAGTLGYISPEQFSGDQEPDPRCDLFSWGVILYELAARRRPYDARDVLGYVHQLATTTPAPLSRHRPDAPPELERIVHKLLHRDPRQRYQSAHEATTDLEALQRQLDPQPLPPIPPRPAPVPPQEPDPLWVKAARWVAAHRRAVVPALGALAVAVLAISFLPPGASRIALPDFINETGDPARDPLAIGFSGDLLNAFLQAGRTPVVRPTLRDMEGRPVRDPAILRVNYKVSSVIHGSLRDPDGATGRALAVHVEAIRTRDNRLEWIEDCQDPDGDVGRLQQMLVSRVLRHFRGPFEPEASPGSDPAPSRPTVAIEAYLRGLGFLADLDHLSAPDSALAAFDHALQLDPGFGGARAGRARALGWIYTTAKDTALLVQAESDARQAVASPSATILGRLALGRLLPELGRTREALAQLDTVLAARPEEAEAHWLMGMVRAKLGELQPARTSFERAMELEPASPKYWRGYGRFLLLSMAEYPGAERAFERAMQLDPHDMRAREMLAAAYTLQCRHAEALRIYEELPPATQLRQDILTNRASAYLWSGRHEDALRGYLEAASASPRDGVIRMALGDCYAHVGRRSDALESYRSSRRFLESERVVNPDDPNLRALHALVLAKLGDHAAARAKVAQWFPALSVPDTEVLHSVAKTLAICGDGDRAIAAIDTLVRGRDYPRCLLAIEDEFEGLRGDPRFKALVGDGRP